MNGIIHLDQRDSIFGVRTIQVTYNVEFHAEGDSLNVWARLMDNDHYDIDFMSLTYDSPEDEEIYGLGLQCTIWDFKGKQVPIISSE